ncbi:hypothetical protein MLD38_022114 [Melastoma candidum]|uniref:Uncharacterized protein n=1 Tax=Melastoma candidum TaxID=119954 RepID=A0ACB9QI31_9MYRT|nr:hypothetical protein MLD38_022114 [Melastoma candidum]
MPQEGGNSGSAAAFVSPGKNLRGLKSLVSGSNDEEIINDYELAHRKAEEAASRRYKAVEWLRQMDSGASATLPKEPSEEEFCLALRNGLILCNVLNKVNPGAVHKVVENPILDIQASEGAAQSAIQYFENMRNFLVAVKDMQLLTFEASDLEKGGSSNKVVDCILCLKGYHEWKEAGAIGVWRYGGTVRITSLPKYPGSSLVGSDSADESVDESDSSQYEQVLEFLHLSNEVSNEESKITNLLTFLFDRFGLGLLQAYLREADGMEDVPLNAMVVDALLSKVVKDFSAVLVSQGTQLALFLKKILRGELGSISRAEFLQAIEQYLRQRMNLASNDMSQFCICGGKRNGVRASAGNCVGHVDEIQQQNKQIKELKFFFHETKLEVRQIQSVWEEEFQLLRDHIQSLEGASSSYHKVLEENRMLYNQVQDLKGTIRVYCRVRPFLTGQSCTQTTVDYIGETGSIMIVNPFKQGKDARRSFTFNKVFSTNATQENIYSDTQPLIRSILDGYNVCIFAYGQTGSGKTYTMSGPDLMTEDTWGVNYRALRDLFLLSKERLDVIKYDVAVQMIEIYNEQVRDLLVTDGSTRRLDIRNNSQLNGLNVPDASLIPVTCTQDVLDLMRIGQKNRAVGATALNVRSSRSHSVLTVHVQGKELVSGSILRGCLHLVDLAGSERVDKSEAVGERLKEAQHINRSLSALGDVISALAQKSPHVPYRNSKLTQLLQDSLGGQAKTLMFVHINPEVNSLGETISTLKFAERVATIELGAAKSNKETGEIRELKEEVSNLKLALERKELELEQYRSAATTRSTVESQKGRTVSPFRVPRYGAGAKPEGVQKPTEDPRITEARSCSSGKQRRTRLPSKFSEKETVSKPVFSGEDQLANSVSPRSESPPIRRSLSNDRASVIKTRHKAEATDGQPFIRVPFPARVPTSRSVATDLFPGPGDNNVRDHPRSQEPQKHENFFDGSPNLSKISTRRVYQEHDDEQFKRALDIRQGGVRKAKIDGKVKAKNQLPTSRTHKFEAVTTTVVTTTTYEGEKIDDPRRSDFSEPENEHVPLGFPPLGSLQVKKHQHGLKNSQNFEERGQNQGTEGMGKPAEIKTQNAFSRQPKESVNSSMHEFRRSRSTPRGKFFLLS